MRHKHSASIALIFLCTNSTMLYAKSNTPSITLPTIVLHSQRNTEPNKRQQQSSPAHQTKKQINSINAYTYQIKNATTPIIMQLRKLPWINLNGSFDRNGGRSPGLNLLGFGQSGENSTLTVIDNMPVSTEAEGGINLSADANNDWKNITVIPYAGSVRYGDQAVAGVILLSHTPATEQDSRTFLQSGSNATAAGGIQINRRTHRNSNISGPPHRELAVTIGANGIKSQGDRPQQKNMHQTISANLQNISNRSNWTARVTHDQQQATYLGPITRSEFLTNPYINSSSISHVSRNTTNWQSNYKYKIHQATISAGYLGSHDNETGDQALSQHPTPFNGHSINQQWQASINNIKIWHSLLQIGAIAISRQYQHKVPSILENKSNTFGTAAYSILEIHINKKTCLKLGSRIAARNINASSYTTNNLTGTSKQINLWQPAYATVAKLTWRLSPHLFISAAHRNHYRFIKNDEINFSPGSSQPRAQQGFTDLISQEYASKKIKWQNTLARVQINNQIWFMPNTNDPYLFTTKNYPQTVHLQWISAIALHPYASWTLRANSMLNSAHLSTGAYSGKKEPFSPNLQLQTSIQWQRNYAYADVTWQYTSKKYALNDFNNTAPEIPGCYSTSLDLGYKKPLWQTSIVMNNIFNQPVADYAIYEPTNHKIYVYPGTGRTFIATLQIVL